MYKSKSSSNILRLIFSKKNSRRIFPLLRNLSKTVFFFLLLFSGMKPNHRNVAKVDGFFLSCFGPPLSRLHPERSRRTLSGQGHVTTEGASVKCGTVKKELVRKGITYIWQLIISCHLLVYGCYYYN